MAHTNYLYRILHRPASHARALINGIPIYDRIVPDNVAPIGPVTHWLVRGENTITVELSPSPRSPLTPDLGPHFEISVRLAEDLDRAVFTWDYPKSVAALGLPIELPLVGGGVLRIDDDLPDPVYRRGSREEFPAEGTVDQRAAVQELYDAFATRDAGRFEAAMDLKVSEFERYYGPQPLSRAEAMKRMNEPWIMEPFDAHDLRFDRYADGRVAYVRRASGKPAVRAQHRDEPTLGWGSNFYMTRLDGRWRIFC
ncbi:hypothetical protein [Polyangium sp. y55x31]|uniref:hypothetical protein n=1 Tax=Polyangium sp. y55x31 TaxID=3042688 RepID=UPI002482207C|nr:hypothetical protein [Polyangium sp. y55x31]MDI1480998.1 hypothetical protein [Polyangium sp. y55x31]